MSAPNLRIAAWFAGTVCTLGNSYENPVLDASTPDPGVLFDPRTRLYWAAVTSGDAAARFPLYTSTDLLSWKAAGHVFPDGKSPSWAKQDFWAPEPHLVNNGTGYAVYYAARNAAGILSVGVATSRDMNGTFVDIGHPLFDSFSDGQIGESRVTQCVVKTSRHVWGKGGHTYVATACHSLSLCAGFCVLQTPPSFATTTASSIWCSRRTATASASPPTSTVLVSAFATLPAAPSALLVSGLTDTAGLRPHATDSCVLLPPDSVGCRSC